MAEIRFYHLTARTLEQTLPVLLERTLQRGWRAVVCVGSEERVETLAGHLWTWCKEGFLPHGTRRDGFAEEQPVWITDQVENPNRAQVLFLGDGADSDGGGGFETVCDLFDGNDTISGGAGVDNVSYANRTTGILAGLEGAEDSIGDNVESVTGSASDDTSSAAGK